jgi:hypothetical protein
MSNMARKLKRAQKKKKKNYQKVSFCSEHGPYTANNLCPCYDKGGQYENVDYETNFRDSMARGATKMMEASEMMAACPIHGAYSLEDLCGCYNESGELKEDWDKDLK